MLVPGTSTYAMYTLIDYISRPEGPVRLYMRSEPQEYPKRESKRIVAVWEANSQVAARNDLEMLNV